MNDVPSGQSSTRSSWGRKLLFPAIFFIGGLGVAGWVVTQTPLGTQFMGHDAVEPIPIDPARLQGADPGTVAPDIGLRLAALEARLARAETAGAAGGVAGSMASNDHISGLVLAFAARRALETGHSLGPIETELRARYGTTSPHLVEAIANLAKQPITVAELKSELTALQPTLVSSSDNWWDRLTESLSSLATVRKAAVQNDQPAVLFESAQLALDSGNVESALATVAKLPRRGAATDWLLKAKRLATATKALDALEARAFEVTPAPAVVEPSAAPLAPAPAANPLPPASDPIGSTGTF